MRTRRCLAQKKRNSKKFRHCSAESVSSAVGSVSDVEVIRLPIHHGEMMGAGFTWTAAKDIVDIRIDPGSKLLADWTVENRKGDWHSN